MKIWKAELVLCYTMDDKNNIIFDFKKQKEDYEFNEHTKDEWIHSEGWICNRIPMDMIVKSNSYSVLKVIQGFDHELNTKELEQLKQKMKKAMIKKLERDKEEYLKEYDDKLKIIQN